ncbi:MAG: ribosome small subunit-dependent GTPase A [Chloroflexota bacterium]
MDDNARDGQIVRLLSGFYTVQNKDGAWVCRIRGRLKRGRAQGDLLALGDRVRFTPLGEGNGIIEEVLPRSHALIRRAPEARGEYQQVLLANPDQVVLVFACSHPAPRFGMLDRFLVISEQQRIPAVSVVNKVDLVGKSEAVRLFAPYQPLGYPLLFTSAKSGLGIESLRACLQGKLSALAGPSGAGKSSLLNAVQPELGLEVREVSQSTFKGRHTTVMRQMFPLAGGGYVADLPGLRMLALWDIAPEEIDGYFRELRYLVQNCQFNDCIHLNEPGCAVRAAVEKGEVSSLRYQSYLRMRFGENETG